MFSKISRKAAVCCAVIAGIGAAISIAGAAHSWGGYHWARTANPFTLKLGDNVSPGWDYYLASASDSWSVLSASSFGLTGVLNTSIIPGGTNQTKGKKTPKNCVPTAGMVEICSAKYGSNGWLGLASIWASGAHITQGTAKVNDTYFSTSKYNTPAWKKFVMCQEIAHTFGLDHQDEIFINPNLGTCMDYTNDPDGTVYGQLSNTNPNAHDYEELEIIYAHFDAAAASGLSALSGKRADADSSDPKEWGKEIHKSKDGKSSLFERDFGKGQKLFTFVLWAK